MNTGDLSPAKDSAARTRRPSALREIHDARLAQTESEPLPVFFARLIQHRKWTILTALIALPLLTMIAVSRMTPLYTAYTALIYQPQKLNVGDIQRVLEPLLPDSSIESQIEIIRSRAILQETVDSLGLILKPEFNEALASHAAHSAGSGSVTDKFGQLFSRLFAALPLLGPSEPPNDRAVNEEVIAKVLKRLDVKVKGRSSVLELAFTSEDPSLAKDVVNRIANLYIDNQLELKFQSMKRATNWLNARLEQLRVQVEESERAVEEFRAQAGLVEGVTKTLVTEEVSSVNRELVEAQTTLAAVEANLAAVRQFARSPGRLESVPEILENPTIRELRTQEATLLSQEAQLAARVGPRHPDLIEVRAQIARLREAIFAEVGRVGRSLESQVRAAQARVDALRGTLEASQGRATRADAAAIRLRALESEARANQELLQTFLSRSKELSQQYEIEEPDARVLSQAYVSNKPTFPKTTLFLIISIAVGLVLGLLLAYIEELLDQTFRTSDEVENALGLPAVAIPRIGRPNWRVPFLDYVLVKPSSVFAETVRSLRTLLWLTDLQSRAKLVAVTSSRRGEGKTTTAVSLARVAAQSGERVIIIDCDLTRPTIHLAFKQGSADSGLTDLVLGRASRREVTRTDPHLATLHYITAGGRANQLSELLRSDNMIALMREVRNEYDLVVVDTPPALVLSDAKVLATMADAVVYCILWRSTSRSVAGAGIKSLLDVGANVLCAALTQVRFRSLRARDRMDHEAYAAGRAARVTTPGTGEVTAWRA